MRAAWYERQGTAEEVLVVGEMADPLPGPGEVRIRVAVSGVNVGDVKKRQDTFGLGMAYPRVIPHSDGAGVIDLVGEGVSSEWLDRRVWCYGAQSYRPFGTAAEFTVVPVEQVVLLDEGVPFERGATIGIPGITAYRAVHVAGAVDGRWVLVQGGAGAVGACAVHLAHRAGARVMAVVRTAGQEAAARRAGTDEVLLLGKGLVEEVKAIAPGGVDHIVEVAFGANIGMDTAVLKNGGSIAAYATNEPMPPLPFWPLAFVNARLLLLGSDDFPIEDKMTAGQAIRQAFNDGWEGLEIGERFPLAEIARAHEWIEEGRGEGRVVVTI